MGAKVEFTFKFKFKFKRTGTAAAVAMNQTHMHGNLLGGPEEEPAEIRDRQVRGQDDLIRDPRFEIRNKPLL
jgi:hypothetical protein